MKLKRNITVLVSLIIAISVIAALFGIFSHNGSGTYEYLSIRGKTVEIYGKGIYRHMSSDVAIQGIAQDYVTLFIGIPVLFISLIAFRKNSIKSRFILAGTSGYFFVTYLFYTAMGMYNIMFLAYITLLGLSFFVLFNLLLSMELVNIKQYFDIKTPVKFVGWFLMVNAFLIALLWLSKILPPLLDGTIYPEDLQHYTTLIVQGFDLGLLLPISFISGLLMVKGTPLGYLAGTTYIVFLSVLMTALTAKIIAMGMNGINVIPVIFIIPSINIITILSSFFMIKNIKNIIM